MYEDPILSVGEGDLRAPRSSNSGRLASNDISGLLSEEEARARLSEASGRLRHRWLWPDVSIAEWREAMGLFERTTQLVLEGDRGEQLDGCPDAIEVAAYTSGMGPLLGYWLESSRLSATPAISKRLSDHLDHNRARMRVLGARSVRIVEALAASAIRPIVLKGMHTAFSYFPEPGARPLADIDLLVRPEQRGAAALALLELGFQPGPISGYPGQQNWRPPDGRSAPLTLRYLHRDDPWSVDLHVSLNRKCGPGTPIVALDEGGLSDFTEPWPLTPAARQMKPAALFVQLLVHAGYGLESLTLLRVCELVLVARQLKPLEWDQVQDLAGSSRALPAIYPALSMVEKLAPGTLPGPLIEASANAVPRSVRRQVRKLSPATVQRVVRTSLAERFMWSSSPALIVRHLWEYATLAHVPPGRRRALFRHRLRRLSRLLGTR